MCSAGCANCYAETMSKRIAAMAAADIARGRTPGRKRHYLEVLNEKGRWNGKIALVYEALEDPLNWKRPRQVFVNSMSDLFHPDVPFDYVDRVFSVMALCPQHTFQILTKRPERMVEYLTAEVPLSSREDMVAGMHPMELDGKPFAWGQTKPDQVKSDTYARRPWPGWPLSNAWLGVSAEDQKSADERYQHLRRCPAAVRFYSAEPLIAPIDRLPLEGIDLCIVGGESGRGARPCGVHWVRSIVRQCRAAGVACFVKQLGANCRMELAEGAIGPRIALKDSKGGDPSEWVEDLRVREFPKG